MAIGKTFDNNAVKPRLPNQISVFYDEYDHGTNSIDILNVYDKTMLEYNKQSGRDSKSCKETCKNYFAIKQYQQLDDESKKVLKEQGIYG